MKRWLYAAVFIIAVAAIITRLAQSREIPKSIRAVTNGIADVFKGVLR